MQEIDSRSVAELLLLLLVMLLSLLRLLLLFLPSRVSYAHLNGVINIYENSPRSLAEVGCCFGWSTDRVRREAQRERFVLPR